MTLFDFLQLTGGLILAVGYIPQIMQLIRTKSSRDLNLRTFVMLTIGIGMMEAYAVNLAASGSGWMFLITNSLSLIIVLYISLLIILSRRKR